VTVPPAVPVEAVAVEDDAGAQQAAEEQARLRLRRGRLVVAGVAVLVAAVVSAVALLGGFADRADPITASAPGSVVKSGPFELTLEKATVRHKTADDRWEVRVSGTIASTDDTSLVPATGESGFLFAKASATQQVSPAGGAELGDPDTIPSRSLVSPGLPPAPWTIDFTFSQEPGPELLVGVFQQKYTTKYLFSDEMSWQTDRGATTTVLPLEQLPDEKY
jgi:hypothetical protein